MGLFADRTSTRKLAGNQLRLYFSAFAYVMMETLRRVGLAGTKLARAQSWTLRVRLLKIGAQVRVTTRKVWLSFSESYPHAALLRTVLAQVQAHPASLLARTSPMEDARLGVRGTDSALESALGGETSLMSAGRRSNAPGHRWISAFVTAFESAARLSNSYG